MIRMNNVMEKDKGERIKAKGKRLKEKVRRVGLRPMEAMEYGIGKAECGKLKQRSERIIVNF
jgi:hypothetical protein